MLWRWFGVRLVSAAIFTGLAPGIVAGVALSAQRAVGQSAPQITQMPADRLGSGAAPLNGLWQFHPGDDPAWASAEIDDATGRDGWESFRADPEWPSQARPGFTWYRRHVRFPPGETIPSNLALLIESNSCSYEVYWNGALVGREGRLPPRPIWKDYKLSDFRLGEARDGVIALRVWQVPLTSFGSGEHWGLTAVPALGSEDAIVGLRAQHDLALSRGGEFGAVLDLLYAMAMSVSLWLWIRDRRQLVLLWLALFCIAPLEFSASVLWFGAPLGSQGTYAILYSSLAIHDIALWLLLLWLMDLHGNRRLVRLTWILGIASFVADTWAGFSFDLVDWSAPSIGSWIAFNDTLANVSIFIGLIYPLMLIALALRKRHGVARWAVAICAVLTVVVSTAGNFFAQAYRPLHWRAEIDVDAPMFFLGASPISMRGAGVSLLLVSIVYAVFQYVREASHRKRLLEAEFTSAREMQQMLVPESLPEVAGYAITSAYKPALEVGGDFFQIIPLGAEHLGAVLIVLGDVSGKGLRAAMTVSLVVGMARALARFTAHPGELLTMLNERLAGRMGGTFVTCIALRVDPGGSCALAVAGHPAPFLNHRELELPGGLPIGIVVAGPYEESTIALAPNDHLALYTDGLLEARSTSGELFGFERLRTLFATNPTATRAAEVAVAFGQDDDITILTVRRLPESERSTVVSARLSSLPSPALPAAPQ